MHSASFVTGYGSLSHDCDSISHAVRRSRAIGECVAGRHPNNCPEPYLSLGTPPVS